MGGWLLTEAGMRDTWDLPYLNSSTAPASSPTAARTQMVRTQTNAHHQRFGRHHKHWVNTLRTFGWKLVEEEQNNTN